jgi:hypothetical protein
MNLELTLFNLNSFRDITIIITLIIIAITIVKSYQLYKTHLYGKRSYDLSVSLFKTIYELRDAIAFIRHTTLRPHENDFIAKNSAVFGEQSKHYKELLIRLHESKHILEIELLEAQNRFGEKTTNTFLAIKEDVTLLERSIESHLDALNPYDTNLLRTKQQAQKDNSVIYAPTMGEDIFRKNLELHIKSVESALSQYLF